MRTTPHGSGLIPALLIGLMLAVPSRAAEAGQSTLDTVVKPWGAAISLDDVGLYTVGCTYRDGRRKQFPVGWTGTFDDATGVACMPFGEQHGKRASLLHCPWRGGTGVTDQEFKFQTPHLSKAVLRGAIAMGTNAVGKSDGATFRIFVNGEKLVDENRKDDVWKDFALDVGRFTGGVITIRFETDPGPMDNPSYDYSLWGDRQLILDGLSVPPKNPIPASPDNLAAASSVGSGDVVPVDGEVGTASVTAASDSISYRWTGKTGKIEYVWRYPRAKDASLFGSISMRSTEGTGPSAHTMETSLGGSASLDWTAEADPDSPHAIRTSTPDGYGYERTVKVGGTSARLRVVGRLIEKSLVFEISCDRPFLREMNIGGWGPTAYRRQVTVPYFSGRVLYLPDRNLFVSSFLDWTRSAASVHDGTGAIYGSLTDGSRRSLRERAIFSASWHLSGALPSIPNPKSGFLKKVGGRTMLDIWGGNFRDIANGFEKLADYGIDDCAAIVHDWQRSGYDNALPAHYPASASKGGDTEMWNLVTTGTRLGYLVSLHENYVDYYPNYEGFRESDIALDSNGNRVLAWYQPGTKIQSFAVKPNAILRLAATQSPEIHKRYSTNADYLDVHSAVPPWFHVDFRASEPGAGMFRQVWNAHRELWAYERETHNGPVFGEGANHWYWSGLLDGVEAQFGVGWPGSQGTTAPLMVDFDLLRIHPLQANHGMGYYERWWPASPWGSVPPMSVLDQYRMQEVAFGHTGFLGGSTWNVLPYAWLENHLLTSITAAYAGVPPQRIEYMVDGRWVDTDIAARTGTWDRVRVLYKNGLVVTANSSRDPLKTEGRVLPQFGWSALGAGVTAWTALRNGAIADYCETADHVFANARDASDWNASGIRRIRPEAIGFRQTGPRRFRLGYRWHVGETVDRDYVAFVHFSHPGAELNPEGILFQGDHPLATPTSAWKADTVVDDGPWDVAIPDNVGDGSYQVGIGLYRQDSGRVRLEGKADEHGRIVLGTVVVSDGGRTIGFVPNDEPLRGGADSDSNHLNQNGIVIDFGTLRTNGSVNIVRRGKEWVLQTFPRNRRFKLELSVARFGAPKQVTRIGAKTQPVRPVVKAGFWRLELNSAKEYRWPVPSAGK